ncbi:MAG TPA: small ribosomal subunit Rsm22 family protein, partial [Terriglobales bacterium]|nr:small ribosomal subunit Rsm22 family protein [Terriglobales bacterium]
MLRVLRCGKDLLAASAAFEIGLFEQMHLRSELQEGVREITAGMSPSDLAHSAAQLTSSYRQRQRTRPQLDATQRAAYLVTRLPATYAVLSHIMREAKLRTAELRVESILDLGAGPGTVMWAAAEQFPELARAINVEVSAAWIEIGKTLAARSSMTALRSAEWRQASVLDPLPAERSDLVVMSYVVNEFGRSDRMRAVHSAWEHAQKLLAIIEPGTPAGFEHIREIRSNLLALGAHVVGPC